MTHVCAHCGEEIEGRGGYPSWFAPIPLPGMRQSDMPKFHLGIDECESAGDEAVSASWGLLQQVRAGDVVGDVLP